MQRFLVLGASGFLGVRLVRALAVASDVGAVFCASRRPTRGWAGFDGVEGGREALELDLADGDPAPFLERLRPTVCVLAAAVSRGDACEREPALAQLVNAVAPGRVAAWCARSGTRLVHVSTDLVFDGELADGARYREGDAPSPLHVYGRTKAEGERAVLAAHPAALVVRLPLLFGDSEGRAIGASDALLAALERGERPRLFVDEWRTPLDVDDAAAALVECARSEHRGLLHVAGPQRLSRHELGLEVLAASGAPAEEVGDRIEPVRRAGLDLDPPRPRDVSLDASEARSILETPLRDVRGALRG